MIGYEGERVDIKSEEYKQQLSERRKEYFQQVQDDVSAADIIHDDAIRKVIKKVLYASVAPNSIIKKDSPTLKDAYAQLEKWIFEP